MPLNCGPIAKHFGFGFAVEHFGTKFLCEKYRNWVSTPFWKACENVLFTFFIDLLPFFSGAEVSST